MLTIPVRYYYTSHSSTLSLAYEGEDIDVDALLDDQEKVYYETQPSGEESTPKVLIFNDINSEGWTSYKRFKIKSVLADLLQQQFQIYYYKLGEWIAFSSQYLDRQLKDYQQHIKALDNDALLTSAVEPLNTPLHALLCLDYFELNALIDSDYDIASCVVFRSDFNASSDDEIKALWKQEVEVVHDILDASEFIRAEDDVVPAGPIKHLYAREYDVSNYGYNQQFEAKVSAVNATLLTELKTVKLAGGVFQPDILGNILGAERNQIECLDVSGYRHDVSALRGVNWSALKMFSYDAPHPFVDLNGVIVEPDGVIQAILKQATRLAHVDLRFNHVTSRSIDVAFGGQALTFLSVRGKKYNLGDIFSTLNQSPKLETLSVAPYWDENDQKHLGAPQPHGLKVLRLGSSNLERGQRMTGAMFQALLKRLPQLQELTFDRPELVDVEDFTLEKGSLPHLKHIGFDLNSIGGIDGIQACLPTLLAAAPNLESFEMWPGTALPAGLALNKLKTVTWFGHLNPERLNAFMASAPNLTSMAVIAYFNHGNKLWEPSDFSEYTSLREIDLYSWSHSGYTTVENTAEALFRSAPNLDSVRISNPEEARQWLTALCEERKIALLPTAYRTKISEVKQASSDQDHASDHQHVSAPIEAIEAAKTVEVSPSFDFITRCLEQKSEQKPDTLRTYLNTLRQGAGRNQLVYLSDRQALNALMLQLEHACGRDHQPIFVANEPRDLNTASRYIKREGNIGTVVSDAESGGKLAAFVAQINASANQNQADAPAPILLINNDNFSISDNTRYNTTFDPVSRRKADKIKLPESMIVIVLMNKGNPESYKKADFISRFAPKYRGHCRLSASLLWDGLPSIMDAPDNARVDQANDVFPIEFYGQDNWTSRLDGHWIMGAQWTWQEGVLAEALQSEKPIALSNAPVENPNFQWYWARKLLQHGAFSTTYAYKGYDWSALNACVVNASDKKNVNETPKLYLLNAKYLAKFFEHYEPELPNMHRVEGWIKANAGQTLQVLQTGNISLGNKARLFTECEKYNVNLVFAPLPEKTPNVQVIQSDDVDYTLEQMLNSEASALPIVIDISEVDASQLLGKITPRYDEAQKRYVFHASDAFLLEKLNHGETVILKGAFTPELIDSLAYLIFFNADFPGKLIMLSAPNAILKLFDPEYRQVSKHDKGEMLRSAYSAEDTGWVIEQLLDKSPDNEPYIHLKRRMGYLMRHKDKLAQQGNLYTFSEKNWNGLARLSDEAPDDYHGDDLMGYRKQKLEAILVEESIALILGKTGGGKTEFIKRAYPEAYMGLDKLPECIEAAKHEQVIWVGDEANLSPSNWSMFETLPHGLFYQETYYAFSAEQAKNFKAIFIGNPYSYGGERKLATLFLRHGNTCIFDPLPAAFIKQHILAPLFYDIDVPVEPVLEPILKAYAFMAQLSSTRVLVTPRELCTLVLLTLSTCDKYPDVSAEDIAYFFTYHISKAITYETYHKAFDRAFPASPQWAPDIEHKRVSKDFFLTDSRKLMLRLLEAFLRLRDFRQANKLTQEQNISGLSTFLIEGEPGQGKTVLLDAVLSEKNAMFIPASMSPEDKKKAYLEAFRTGRIIRADESNTVAMFEKEMNTLRSGYDFETDKISDNPGFMLFESQNPIIMGGRRAMSNAEARRTFTWQLNNYTYDELCQITQHYGVGEAHAKDLVTQFQMRVRQQQLNDETPWTVRELIDLARDIYAGPARTIQTAFRRHRETNTLESLRTLRADASALIIQKNARRYIERHTLETLREASSSSCAWLLEFLPELPDLAAGLLFLAGLALLVSAVAPVGVAVSLMTLGGGLFAAHHMYNRCHQDACDASDVDVSKVEVQTL